MSLTATDTATVVDLKDGTSEYICNLFVSRNTSKYKKC